MSKISENMIREYFFRWFIFPVLLIVNIFAIIVSIMTLHFLSLIIIGSQTLLLPFTHLFGYYTEMYVPENSKKPLYKYVSLRAIVISKMESDDKARSA